MITLVPDSNALRHPSLAAFLRASRDHAVALSDLISLSIERWKRSSSVSRTFSSKSSIQSNSWRKRRVSQSPTSCLNASRAFASSVLRGAS